MIEWRSRHPSPVCRWELIECRSNGSECGRSCTAAAGDRTGSSLMRANFIGERSIVLKNYGESTQQTYAYGLADHLNWLHANRLDIPSVTEDDLRRYMNALTGRGSGVFGIAWRDRPPVGGSAGANVATIVKAFYLESASTKPSVTRMAFGQDSR